MLNKRKIPRVSLKAAEAFKTKCEGYSLVVKAWMPAILLLIIAGMIIILAALGIDPAILLQLVPLLGN